MDKYKILKDIYGYDTFLEGQEELIDSTLNKKDTLGIMPTGAGKSICYQVPALLFDGISIIVSPLISLMKDQVKALNEVGVHAAYINSSLTEVQIRKAMENARLGKYKIIYVAPERLMTESFLALIDAVNISMIAVDEAHCISQWGQDFRPSYLKIVDFINRFPKRPVIAAYTATATKTVKEDIICILGLINPTVVVTGYDRKNLY
ncbi:MAG: recQ, partial [Eubacterium sp.]|nr:recQ [Eubacterium sp.]